MSRKRRTSTILEKASDHQKSLTAIDLNWDFANSFNAAGYQNVINKTALVLDEYNKLTAQLDDKTNELNASERALETYASNVLSGAKMVKGKDHSLYQAAGGVMTSERKKPGRKPKDK